MDLTQEQYATTPCWPQLDEILRDLLAWLHHSIGRNVLSLDEGAEQFSHIVSDLLLEYQVITLPSGNGRHRLRRLETTLIKPICNEEQFPQAYTR